jgi:ribonuclease BN (tRNA processing enzyme)
MGHDDETDKYAEEARSRWGNTDAYRQSQERVRKMGKEGMKKVREESDRLTEEIAKMMKAGHKADSKPVQRLIAGHYEGLRAFYEPNPEMYRGLAEMYIADDRFKAHYEKFATGLAQFMHDAMINYIEKDRDKD